MNNEFSLNIVFNHIHVYKDTKVLYSSLPKEKEINKEINKQKKKIYLVPIHSEIDGSEHGKHRII